MFAKIKTFWKAWNIYSEVKDMDKTSLIKIIVAGVAAAIATASAAFLETDVVSWQEVGGAAVAAILLWLKKSPIE